MERDPQLEQAVWDAVDRCFLQGQHHETKRDHFVTVLRQVAHILNLPLPCQHEQKLSKLFGVTFHPADMSNLLEQYIRKNSIGKEKLIKNRDVFIILAVDGFEGLLDLKPYLFTHQNNLHTAAVQKMYAKIDTLPISSLSGTDSACVIFLSLLKLFGNLIYDDQILIMVDLIRKRVENFMHRHAHYYQDIRLINDAMLNELIGVYTETNPDWHTVALEKTNSILKNKQFNMIR